MGKRALDRTGLRYGRLVALERAAPRPDGRVVWRCRCDCGNIVDAAGNSLGAGSTRSCGCLVAETRHRGSVDYSGMIFGRLTAITPTADRTSSGGVIWLCRCECGGEKSIPATALTSGNTKSCGCLYLEREPPNLKHGLTGTPTYRAWAAMRQRCLNPNDARWVDYGGRGITVCDAWRGSFEAFLADMGLRPDGLTLDRIDNDGNYEPGNCRWATGAEQRSNQRKRLKYQHAPLPGQACVLCGMRPTLRRVTIQRRATNHLVAV